MSLGGAGVPLPLHSSRTASIVTAGVGARGALLGGAVTLKAFRSARLFSSAMMVSACACVYHRAGGCMR
jgi:hypothetical protein